MPGVKMDPGKVYDLMVKEGGLQTMPRAEFIKKCKELMCPHRKMADLTKLTMDRDRRRTTGLYSRNKINKAMEN